MDLKEATNRIAAQKELVAKIREEERWARSSSGRRSSSTDSSSP